MTHFEQIGLSVVNPGLAKVELIEEGGWWRAEVKVEELLFIGQGEDKVAAVGRLLSSVLLRGALKRRQVEEPQGRTGEEREKFAKRMRLPPRGWGG